MEESLIQTIEALQNENYELKKLWQEHSDLDVQIERLAGNGRPLLTAEEEELAQMRKRKLAGKDRIYEILRELGHV